jgi:hypothetical protein
LNPRYWPGRLEERHGDAEGGGGDGGVAEEDGVTLLPLGVAVLPSSVLVADGGVGDVDVETTPAVVPPLLEDAPTGTGADVAASGPPGGGGGGGGGSPPAAPEASTPSPTPTNDAVARLATARAADVMAPTIVIIVLPTSPRTMRLAMSGINAIEKEKILAVSARSIISLEPTKLFKTPLAPRTAFMLDRFTADMRT